MLRTGRYLLHNDSCRPSPRLWTGQGLMPGEVARFRILSRSAYSPLHPVPDVPMACCQTSSRRLGWKRWPRLSYKLKSKFGEEGDKDFAIKLKSFPTHLCCSPCAHPPATVPPLSLSRCVELMKSTTSPPAGLAVTRSYKMETPT